MSPTHRHCRQNDFSAKERRLVWIDRPPEHHDLNFPIDDVDLDLERIELTELQQKKWDHVEKIINLAVLRWGTKNVREDWEDPVTRRSILAAVVFREDGLYDYLPDTAKDLGELVNKALEDETEQIERWKRELTAHVDKYFDTHVKKARELDRPNPFVEELKFLGLGGDDGDASYPFARDIDTLVEGLRKEEVTGRVNAVVDINLAIVKSDDKEFADFMQKFKTMLESFPVDVGGVTTNLYLVFEDEIKNFPATMDIQERKNELHKILAGLSIIVLPDELTKKLEQALEETRTKKAAAESAGKEKVLEAMRPDMISISRIAGNDIHGIVGSSIDNTGKLDLGLLKKHTEIAGAEDFARIEAGILKAAGIDAAATSFPPLDKEETGQFVKEHTIKDGAGVTIYTPTEPIIQTLLKKMLSEGGPAMRTLPEWKTLSDNALIHADAEHQKLGRTINKGEFKTEFEEDFENALLRTWDREPLTEHLKNAKGLFLGTNRGSDFGAFVLRARLPEKVAEDLIRAEMGGGEKGIGISTLIEIAKLEDPAPAATVLRSTAEIPPEDPRVSAIPGFLRRALKDLGREADYDSHELAVQTQIAKINRSYDEITNEKDAFRNEIMDAVDDIGTEIAAYAVAAGPAVAAKETLIMGKINTLFNETLTTDLLIPATLSRRAKPFFADDVPGLRRFRAVGGRPAEVFDRVGAIESLKDIYLDDTVNDLKDYVETKIGIKGAGVLGVLQDYAHPRAEHVTKTGAERLAKMLTEHNAYDGSYELRSKDQLLEVLTFLFLERKATLSPAQISDRAREKAEAFYQLLVGSNVIKHEGGDDVVAGGDLTKLADFLETSLRVGDIGLGHARTLAGSSFKDISYYGAGEDYLERVWEDGGSVLGSIIDRFESLPKFVDPVVLDEITKHRHEKNAYGEYESLLMALLNGREEGKDILGSVVADMEKYEGRISKGTGDTTSRKIMAQLEEGLLAAEVGSLAKREYESLHTLYADLPPQVRNVMMWLAVRRGRKGIDDAKAFLEEYYQSPKAYAALMKQSQVFDGNPGDNGAYDLYKKTLEEYQKTVPLDDKEVADLHRTLTAYHEAVRDGLPATDVALAKAAYDTALTVYMRRVGAYEAKRKNPNIARREFLRKFMMRLASDVHPDGTPKSADEKARDLADFENLKMYMGKVDILEEREGRDELKSMENKFGLTINQLELMALSNAMVNAPMPGDPETTLTRGSFAATRWLDEDHRPLARLPLQIVLSGPERAKQAFIDAYVFGIDQEVPMVNLDGSVTMKKFKAAEVFEEVKNIRALLGKHSTEQHTSLKYIKDPENFFQDPFDKSFRSGIEAIQDLWAGDMVDKGKVILAVAAGIWLIRHIWKKAATDEGGFWKLARMALVGIPLAVVGNAIVKKATGKDYLGSFFLWRPKEQRESALELYRTNQMAKYAILDHPAGIVALEELTTTKDPIDIDDLMLWREKVDANGYRNYEATAPASIKKHLNIGRIRAQLPGGDKEEAYKVAFDCFEALLNDIAFLNDMSGPESGERHIRNFYQEKIQFKKYADAYERTKDPKYKVFADLYKELQGKTITMLDVIISEYRIHGHKAKARMFRTKMEKCTDFASVVASTVGDSGDRVYGAAAMIFEQGVELKDKLYDIVTKKGPLAASAAFDLLRSGATLAWAGIAEEARGAWRLIYGTLTDAGFSIRRADEGFEWFADGTVSLGLGALHAIYLTIDEHTLAGGDLLRGIEVWLEKNDYYTISELILLGIKIPKDKERVSKLSERIGFKTRLEATVIPTIGSFVPIERDPSRPPDAVDTWILAAARDMGIPGIAGDIADFDKLPPYLQMMVEEEVKKRVHVRILARYIRLVESRGGVTEGLRSVDGIDWSDLGTHDALEQALLDSFGVRTMILMNLEQKWTGDLARYIASLKRGGRSAEANAYGVVKWLLDWFERHDAREYTSTAHRVTRERFAEEAKEALGADTDLYKYYLGYIDTAFANIALELALDGNRDPAGKFKGEHSAFELVIRDATDMLGALKILRASSLDSKEMLRDAGNKAQLEKHLKIFHTIDPLPDIDPYALPAPASAPDEADANKEADAIVAKVRAGTPLELADLPKIYNILENASDDRIRKLRDAALPLISDPAMIENILNAEEQFERNGKVKSRERARYFINSAASKLMTDMVRNELKTLPGGLDELIRNRAAWEARIGRLYEIVRKQPTLDPVSEELADNISAFLEFVHYIEKDGGGYKVSRRGKEADFKAFLDRSVGPGLEPTTNTVLRRNIIRLQANYDTFVDRFKAGDEAPVTVGAIDSGHYNGRLGANDDILNNP